MAADKHVAQLVLMNPLFASGHRSVINVHVLSVIFPQL